ncbi:MAG TPA: VOC family protein [Thermomicrobiales bacterium]|nr:VOC family protein [Thermomicrobiales bacterium]
MRLNHLNLTVTDVTAASEFLVKWFGLTNQGGNAGMMFLTDGPVYDGMILSLMKARPDRFGGYPETFHIGFFIESREEVDDLAARLREDGYDAAVPEDTGHSYGFYVQAPGGFTVEVGA